MTAPSAIVVGGGLAGMAVARELALRRWRVILIERWKRLGGKAGSDILLIPVVGVARVIAWLEEKFSPHRPDASEVRRKATPRLQKDSRPPRKR